MYQIVLFALTIVAIPYVDILLVPVAPVPPKYNVSDVIATLDVKLPVIIEQ